MTTTPEDWEEMAEEQANEYGVFECPTCGHLRDASELSPEEAHEWAASRGGEDRADLTEPAPRPLDARRAA
jgi:hypothetical protein